MNENKINKKMYGPNLTYELLIHGVYHYVGCHTRANSIHKCTIVGDSGNYLNRARQNGFITRQEYNECVELIRVTEYETKEEALLAEEKEIQECMDKYGKLCVNRCVTKNNRPPKGFQHSEEHNKRVSKTKKEYFKTHDVWNKGLVGSNNLNKQWFTNGKECTMTFECPEGWKPGRIMNITKPARSALGKKWFTNGTDNYLGFECPNGYYLGRTMKKKKDN